MAIARGILANGTSATIIPTVHRTGDFRKRYTIPPGALHPLRIILGMIISTTTIDTMEQLRLLKGYCTDVWFDEAMDWIEEQGRTRRFLRTSPPTHPIPRCGVLDEYRQPYLDQVAYNVASFYGMIANIDDNMGKLDAFLRKTGLRDNTILIFMTDNGDGKWRNRVQRRHGAGKKTTLYEGGPPRSVFYSLARRNSWAKPRDIPDSHGTVQMYCQPSSPSATSANQKEPPVMASP